MPFSKKDWIELKLKDIGIDSIPTNLCQITFQGNICIQNLGQIIKPAITKEEPHLYYRHDPEKLYTAMMIDPDAPSRAQSQPNKNWLHWVKVNIPGSNVNVGETTVTYVPCGPPKDTGLHRYLILVFEQKKSIYWPKFDWLQKTVENRENFEISEFVEKFGDKFLTSKEPVSVGCWRAEWDDSVPELYEELQYNYEAMPRMLLAQING